VYFAAHGKQVPKHRCDGVSSVVTPDPATGVCTFIGDSISHCRALSKTTEGVTTANGLIQCRKTFAEN